MLVNLCCVWTTSLKKRFIIIIIEENELGSDSRQVPNIFMNWSLGSLFPWIRKYNWNIKVIL